MGAWGTKAFEDDGTCDWYDEFCDSEQTIEQLEDAFEDVIENEDYLDYEFCTAALAAAEILAAARLKLYRKEGLCRILQRLCCLVDQQ